MGRKKGGRNAFHKPATTVIRVPEKEKWAFEKMKEVLKEDRGDSIDETVYPSMESAMEKAKEYALNSRRSIYLYHREFYYWISYIRPEEIKSYADRMDSSGFALVMELKEGRVVSS